MKQGSNVDDKDTNILPQQSCKSKSILKAKETKKCRHRDVLPIVTNEDTFML
jgi:hypothetical protein